MFFLAFINRKFWWPKKRKFKFSKFLFFVLKKRNRNRPILLFRTKKSLGRYSKRNFFYLFSKIWLLRKFTRYNNRRRVSIYRYVKRNLNNLHFISRRARTTTSVQQLPRLILRFTFNNIFFTVQNNMYKNITYFSSGSVGFSGPTKKTSFAFEQTLGRICNYLKNKRLKKIHLIVLSAGFSFRTRSVIELLFRSRVNVKLITYKIKLPHNGIRSRKLKRR